MKTKAVRYSQLKYEEIPFEPFVKRFKGVTVISGLQVKSFCERLLVSVKAGILIRGRKALSRRLFALIAVFLLALIPAPKAHAAYYDPIVLGTPDIASVKPLELINLPEQTPLALMAVANKPPSVVNLYEWGNCTWGVASWIGVPQDLGNANTWDDIARSRGLTVTDVPLAGAVAQTDAGQYGHVALVLDVKGPLVLIKEMNSLGLGLVDERWVPVGAFKYIYF